VTFTLGDMRALALKARMLNPAFLGSTVTYRRADGVQFSLDCHVRHVERTPDEDDGRGELSIPEQIVVRIAKENLPDGPVRGDTVQIHSQDKPYIYSYVQRQDQWMWVVTFERRVSPALAGQRGRVDMRR